jgi:hypothetical protein
MDRLRSVLEQVQGGKKAFLPEDSTPQALASFQPIAAALKHANDIGYLSAVFRVSKMIDSHGNVLEAIVTSPLSHQGLVYLEAPVLTQKQQQVPKEPDVLQLKPNIWGIGIDLRAAINWLKRRWRK